MQGPKKCDACQQTINDVVYDTATIFGRWGYLCPECNKQQGITGGHDERLRTGVGQKYEKQADGTFKKVAG